MLLLLGERGTEEGRGTLVRCPVCALTMREPRFSRAVAPQPGVGSQPPLPLLAPECAVRKAGQSARAFLTVEASSEQLSLAQMNDHVGGGKQPLQGID